MILRWNQAEQKDEPHGNNLADYQDTKRWIVQSHVLKCGWPLSWLRLSCEGADMSKEDIGRLNGFISDTREDIDLVVSNLDILIPEQRELHGLVMRAWKDVRPRFEEMSLYIVGEKKLEGLQKQLKGKGLTGVQLKLKLSVYEARRNEFQRGWDRLERASEDKKEEWRVFMRRPIFMRRIIKRLFSIIDVILDSLGFIPGAEAAKEVKGTIENLLF